MIKPKLNKDSYKIERAMCDNNDERVTNEIRGRVEQYEIINGLHDSFIAYLNNNHAATTWMGDMLSHDSICTGEWSINSYLSNKMSQYVFKIGDREYTGRGMGSGMSIYLKETAKSRRKNFK